MRWARRWAARLPVLVLAVALTSCGGGANEAGTNAAAEASQAPAPAEPATWWQPGLSSVWTLQLSGAVQPAPDSTVVDADLFDTPVATITAWHQRGLRVVCYFSAGSSEDWRADYAAFTTADQGNALGGWPGERWLDTRSSNVRRIMAARMDMARDKACDGVDPDNVDGYTNATGLPLTAATQLDYNRWLADAAHARGLAIGLKNDIDQLVALAPTFDFAVNEQCHQYGECDGYSAFIAIGKPVLNAEYAAEYVSNTGGARDALCADAKALGLHTQVLPLALDGSSRVVCP